LSPPPPPTAGRVQEQRTRYEDNKARKNMIKNHSKSIFNNKTAL
jgi:hypothetical protein